MHAGFVFALAGPNSSSKQKEDPHIDLPLFPSLSKSLTENCKVTKARFLNLDQINISVHKPVINVQEQ